MIQYGLPADHQRVCEVGDFSRVPCLICSCLCRHAQDLVSFSHPTAIARHRFACSYAANMSSDTVTFTAPLSQGFGYGIIIGLGFAFALLMIFITWALKRYVVHSHFNHGLWPLQALESSETYGSCVDTRMRCRHRKCSQRLEDQSSRAWLPRQLSVVGHGLQLFFSRLLWPTSTASRVLSSMHQVLTASNNTVNIILIR